MSGNLDKRTAQDTAKTRLENGTGTFKDKVIYKDPTLTKIAVSNFLIMLFIIFPITFIFNAFIGFILCVFEVIFLLSVLIYYLFIKDYTKKEIKTESPKISSKKVVYTERNPYKIKINNLIELFDVKEQNARNLIEEKFESPQLTYDTFISSLTAYSEIFHSQSQIALAIADTNNISEIEEKINVLKSLIKKLDEFSDELLLNINKSENQNVENVLEDMDRLIDSIKDY